MKRPIKIKDMDLMVPYRVSGNYDRNEEFSRFVIWKSNDSSVNNDHGDIAEYANKLFFVVEHEISEDSIATRKAKMSRVICDGNLGFVFSNNNFYGTKVIEEDDE